MRKSLIPVYKNRQVAAFAIVDQDDIEMLSQFRWRLNSSGYPVTGNKEMVFMGRLILGLSRGDGFDCDHMNGKILDHRKCNLRAVPHKLNTQNVKSRRGSTSQYRGVSWYAAGQKWQVHVKIDGRNHYLGRFDDEHEAGRVAQRFRLAHMPGALA